MLLSRITKMGAKNNAGCRFLKAGCKDTQCIGSNTITCKGVLQILRNQTHLSNNLLRSLDSGMLITFNNMPHIICMINLCSLLST